MRSDVREALRSLIADRGVTVVVIATLTLVIGINTTIFSVLNGVLFRPLPYPHGDRLVSLFENNVEMSVDRSRVSGATYLDWRERARSFASMGAFRYLGFTLTGNGDPERVSSVEVSPRMFDVLGVPALLGRTFTQAEEQPGNEHLLILSHAIWRQRFGGDPAIVDRTLMVDGQPYTVVGVMPPSFRFPADDPAVEAWSPLTLDLEALLSRPHRTYYAIGRLAPGASLERARAEMEEVAGQIARENPESNAGWGVTLVPTKEQILGATSTTLWFLFIAVTMVLLIGCANIANLLLARSTRRARDFAVRAAFGARGWALLRRSLSESILLSLAGGLAGVLLAVAGVHVLRPLIPTGIPRTDLIGIDGTVLLFTVIVSIGAGLLFGLAPALRLMRPDIARILQASGRAATAGRRSRRIANSLIAAEVALALVLLSGAGLLVRSFTRLLDVDPGFRTDGRVAIDIALSPARYPRSAQQRDFFESLVRDIRTLPGVETAGAVSVLPMSPLGVQFEIPFTVAGLEARSPSERPRGDYRGVIAGYFEAMAIPIAQGRSFDEFDGGDGRKVAIINQTLARRYFPAIDPVGRFVDMPMAGNLEIVGIAGDVLQGGPGTEARPEVFVPYAQLPLSEMHIVVNTTVAADRLVAQLRDVVNRHDPELPIARVERLDELLAQSVAEPRFNMILLSVLAACALILSAVGIYGIVSYSVAQRTGEIGLRMALGAGRGATLRLIVREVVLVLGAGIVLGLAGFAAAAGFTRGFLFDVSPADPLTHLAVALGLLATGVFAAVRPAMAAARVDPLVALRAD
jgi:putative ABC transport system permease protein